ncbi:MAG: ABC transporter permease subunit, partial [Pseudomonadota bacterium]|nr:ABC transporter permease subunit [Pseudomonadota bacterium]
MGGSIDELLFSDTLPAPTMGSPGVFWAALTMAILTLPVVIVATEEGLRRVPVGLKAGSYALGATKIETIVRTVLPIASPGIMTGVILAIARAAGEVAPLMLV